MDLRELYPEYTERELQAAEANLKRYAALLLRMYERLSSDPIEYARWKALTPPRSRSTFKKPPSDTAQ